MQPDQPKLPEGVERLSPNWHTGYMEANPEGVLMRVADRYIIEAAAVERERERLLGKTAHEAVRLELQEGVHPSPHATADALLRAVYAALDDQEDSNG